MVFSSITLRYRYLAALALFVASTALLADESLSIWNAPWRVGVEVQGWLPEAPATLEVKETPVSGLPSSGGLPEDLDEILSALQMYGMFKLDINKGRLGAFVDALYYKGKISEGFTGTLGQPRRVTIRESLWLIDYGMSYDVARWKLGVKPGRAGTVTLSPYLGARWFLDDLTLSTDTGVFGDSFFLDTTVNTMSPIVGGIGSWWVTDSIHLNVRGDYGGFDVREMHETYQIKGVVEYHFKWKKQSAKVFAGYRYLKAELENSDLLLEVAIKGPLIGFGLQF